MKIKECANCRHTLTEAGAGYMLVPNVETRVLAERHPELAGLLEAYRQRSDLRRERYLDIERGLGADESAVDRGEWFLTGTEYRSLCRDILRIPAEQEAVSCSAAAAEEDPFLPSSDFDIPAAGTVPASTVTSHNGDDPKAGRYQLRALDPARNDGRET